MINFAKSNLAYNPYINEDEDECGKRKDKEAKNQKRGEQKLKSIRFK